MSNPLVSPIFSTGPNDNLAAIDIYKANPSQIVNSIQELSMSIGKNVESLMNGLRNTDFGKLIKISKKGISFNKDQIAARLIGTSSSIQNNFRSLDKFTKENIINNFKDTGQLFVKVNGILSQVNSIEFDKVSSLSEFVNSYVDSNIFEIEDISSLSGLVAGVINESLDNGVRGLLPNLIQGMDPTVVNRVFSQTIPKLLENADLDSLEFISTSDFAKTVNLLYPDFSNKLVSSIKKITTNYLENTDVFEKILNILSGVDSFWDTHTHPNGYVIRGMPSQSIEGKSIIRLQKANQEFMRYFLSGVKKLPDDSDNKVYAVVTLYNRPTTLESEIKRFFPRVALPTNSKNPLNKPVQKNKVIDPRTNNNLGKIIKNVI